MCWSASRERWRDRRRCSSGGSAVAGQASFDRLWQSLAERHGRTAGTRLMIELLGCGKQCGWDRLKQAVEQALALGSTDAAAVRHLLSFNELERPARDGCELEQGLERYERPLPVLSEYDLLLAKAEAEVAR